MSTLFASLAPHGYRRSWDGLILALLRGTLFTLLLLIPLWVGARQTPGVNPWLYALRVGIPLGEHTTFSTVSMEVWAVQRQYRPLFFLVLLQVPLITAILLLYALSDRLLRKFNKAS